MATIAGRLSLLLWRRSAPLGGGLRRGRSLLSLLLGGGLRCGALLGGGLRRGRNGLPAGANISAEPPTVLFGYGWPPRIFQVLDP
jgi:hypothetical protein